MAAHLLRDAFYGLEHATALSFWELFLEDHSASYADYDDTPDIFNGDYLALDAPMDTERIQWVLTAACDYLDANDQGDDWELQWPLVLVDAPFFFNFSHSSQAQLGETRAQAARVILARTHQITEPCSRFRARRRKPFPR